MIDKSVKIRKENYVLQTEYKCDGDDQGGPQPPPPWKEDKDKEKKEDKKEDETK